MCTPATKARLKAALREMAEEARTLEKPFELALMDAFEELELELKGLGQYEGRMVVMAPIPGFQSASERFRRK